MKLRIRFGKEKDFVIVEESIPVLSHLREAIRAKLNLWSDSDFDLSLNGKDVLQDEGSSPLGDLGIVSGDMIYVIAGESMSVDTNSATGQDVHYSLLTQLMDLGFHQQDALKALQETNYSSLENALENLLAQQGCSSRPDISTSSLENSSTSSLENSSTDNSSTENSTSVSSTENSASIPSTEGSIDESRLSTEDSIDNSVTPEDVPDMSSHSSSKTVVTVLPVPVLCRDGIPHLLDTIYCESTVLTLHDALCVVLHVLMMEAGFQVNFAENESTKHADASEEESAALEKEKTLVPVTFQGSGLTKLSYHHSNCPGINITVSLTSIGNYVMAHGFLEGIEDSEIYQSKICVTDFVKSSVSLSQGPNCVYQNLHKLSRLVKDQLCLPLIAASRSCLGLPELDGFMALPPEVKLNIFLLLDIKSILNLSQVCKELYSFMGDNNLWRHLVMREFKTIRSSNYKKDYISLYRECQRTNRWIPPHMPSCPSRRFQYPPVPPGFIGGFYDMYPPVPFMPSRMDPPPIIYPPQYHPANILHSMRPRPRIDPYDPGQGEDMESHIQGSNSLRSNHHPNTQRHFSGTRRFFPPF